MDTEIPIENTTLAKQSLDMYVPEKIIENLKNMEDCTLELADLIRNTQFSQLKKLTTVFLALDNFEMENIIEITTSKKRFQRYNATFLILSWIKQKFLDLKKINEIEAVYETVFVPRFRDVDPAIRAMCVQFLTDWATCSKTIRQMNYLKYLGWALNDRSDSVRKKALRGIFRFSKKRETKRDELSNFLEKYKNRILEMAESDINVNVQKDASKVLISIYLKNPDVFTREEIIGILLCNTEISEIKTLVFQKICSESIWDLNLLHELIKESEECSKAKNRNLNHFSLFKNMKLTENDQNSFILNIIEFVKQNSQCCNENSLCFLSILKELKLTVDPAIFLTLLSIVKDNPSNIKLVVDCLSSVNSFSEHPASTFKILNEISVLAKNECKFIEEFVHLLKKLENDFSLQVNQIISELKSLYPLHFIRHFDISDQIDFKSSSPIVQCYLALWKIMKNEYEWISVLNFDMRNEKCSIQSFYELIDFMVFLIKKIPFKSSEINEDLSCMDPIKAGKILFDKLSAFIMNNCDFNDEISCIFLFKLILMGHFTVLAKNLFKFCSEEKLKNLFLQTKDLKAVTFKALSIGYFDFLNELKINKKVDVALPEIAKILANKISKTDSERYVFSYLKKLSSRTELLDTILIYFVPILNTSESIVLENLVQKSKMKNLLLKKCKNAKCTDENVTFI